MCVLEDVIPPEAQRERKKMDNPGTLVVLVIITLLCEFFFFFFFLIIKWHEQFELTFMTLVKVPPLGVFFVSGFSVDFIINILLTILA